MKALLRLVLPDEETRDPAFREEVGRLSVTGLRVIALVGVGANLLSYLLWLVWVSALPAWMLSSDALGLVLVAIGFVLSLWRGFRPYARSVCLILLFVSFSQQILAAVSNNDSPVDIRAFRSHRGLDDEQLAAVFSNLVRNAAAAISTKGTIRIRTAAKGSEILMEVDDDGHGIAASRLSSLFEPSLKSENGRVGTSNWGLFVSRGIVTDHGGRIEIESEEGKGTIVRIRLAVTSGAVVA